MNFIDLRQTKQYAKYIKNLGWEVFNIDGNYLYKRNLKLFSIIKLQRPQNMISKDKFLSFIKAPKGLVVIYIEPKTIDQEKYWIDLGFKAINSSSLASKTIRFDLTRAENKLFSDMHHKTRYNIRLATKRGIDLILDDDINEFIDFWHDSAKKRKMYFSLRKEINSIFFAFGNNAEILWAVKNNQKLASILVLYTKEGGYYMYAASSEEGNKDQSPSFLVWEAIKRCKNKRLKFFDLEGVYDERYPIKSWKGFSKFKKSFGSEEIDFPGSMRKIYFSFWK